MIRVFMCLQLLFIAISIFFVPALHSNNFKCAPTPPDAKGPFYKPDAPVRHSVGSGYVLTGIVKSAEDCHPIADAKIEFWMAGPEGDYDAAHRGTIFVDQSGRYRIESGYPPDYGFRPPHIHLQITASRFEGLVTQHYPKTGTTDGVLDLVLRPR